MFIQLFNPATYYRDIELASLKYHMYITCDPINKEGYIPDEHTPMNGDEFPSGEFDVRPISFDQIPSLNVNKKKNGLNNRYTSKHLKNSSKAQKHLAYQEDLFDCLEFEMSDSVCIDFKGKVSLINHHLHFTFYHHTNTSEYSSTKAKQAKTMIKKYIQSKYFKNQNKLEKISEAKMNVNIGKFNEIIYKAFSENNRVDYKVLNKYFEKVHHQEQARKEQDRKLKTPHHINLSDDDLPF